MDTNYSATTSGLCYLRADRVEGPLPNFDRLDVRNQDNATIGRLDGIVIDPAAHRMRYFVVETGRFCRHRYLIPFGPSRVDIRDRALRVQVDSDVLARCREFQPSAFPSFVADPNTEWRAA